MESKELHTAAVIYMDTMSGHPLIPLPSGLDVGHILKRSEVILYNPFNPVMPYETLRQGDISYKALQRGRVLTSLNEIEHVMQQNDTEITMQKSIEISLTALWPEAVRMFKELARFQIPVNKKEQALDDIMLVQQKPKQTIGRPSIKPKPTLRAK